MVEKEKEMVRQQENLRFLKEQQIKTESDICEIKSTLSNLDLNTSLMKDGIDRLVEENRGQDTKAEKRDKMMQEVINEIRDMKQGQRIQLAEQMRKEEALDVKIESINKELESHKRELKIETQKLREDIDLYVNRTSFDWFDAFNDGVQSVLTEGMKLGAAAMIIYSIMKLADKFK